MAKLPKNEKLTKVISGHCRIQEKVEKVFLRSAAKLRGAPLDSFALSAHAAK